MLTHRLRYLQTLQYGRKDAHGSTRTSSLSGLGAEPGPNGTGQASMTELLSIPAIRALTFSGFALSFLTIAFDVVFALFCYTPIDAGGLGLEVSCRTAVQHLRRALSILTALRDRKCPRVRRDTRRPPPVLRHALHPATFRLRQDVQRVHVYLADRFWLSPNPQLPRAHLQ